MILPTDTVPEINLSIDDNGKDVLCHGKPLQENLSGSGTEPPAVSNQNLVITAEMAKTFFFQVMENMYYVIGEKTLPSKIQYGQDL